MSAHYVYRVFDADDRLIYVGCTKNLFGRLAAHGRNTWWAPQAVRATARVYRSKVEARRVERDAIRSENPRWNVMGKWAGRSTWTAADYTDYITAFRNAYRMTPAREGHLQRVVAAQAAITTNLPVEAIA